MDDEKDKELSLTDIKPKKKERYVIKPRFTSENQPEGTGRKKGSKNKKTLIKMLLESHVADAICDDEVSRAKFNEVAKHLGERNTTQLAMYLAMIGKVVNGQDVSAFNAIMDRFEGKPVQKNVNVNTEASLEDVLLNMDGPSVDNEES